MVKKIYASLEKYNETDQVFLSSVLYRAGVWMSYADMHGGVHSIKKEMDTLKHMIEVIAGDVCESSFVQELAEKTLENEKRWEDWQKNPDNFPSECQRAVDMVSSQISPEDLMSLKMVILEISLAVARAYNERFEQKDIGNKVKAMTSLWVDRTLTRIQGVGEDRMSIYDEVNISEKEESALRDLALVLRADIQEISEGYHKRLGTLS